MTISTNAHRRQPRQPADQYGRVPYAMVDAGIVAAMNATDRGVYIVIMAHANGTDWTAAPGVARIASLTGHDPRTVQRSIERLVRLGVITVEHGGGRAKCNRYTLTTDAKPRQLDATLSSAKPRQSCATVCDAKPRQRRPETPAAGPLNPGSSFALNPGRAVPGEQLLTARTTNNIGGSAAPDVVVGGRENEEENGEAAGKEDIVRRAFGDAAAIVVRPFLSDMPDHQVEAWIAEANAKGTKPAAYFVKAIQGGWDLSPPQHRPGEYEKQTAQQRAENVRERVRCNYTMALREGTPDQRAVIERRFGDLDALIITDPLGFETDKASKIPVETLGRLVSLNGSAASTTGEPTP